MIYNLFIFLFIYANILYIYISLSVHTCTGFKIQHLKS